MQNHVHPHYTLPGIMHYLQTEFTKNERDRITWQLERLEMKSYIMKLEGENRDLKRRILELEQQQVALASTAEQTTSTDGAPVNSAEEESKLGTAPAPSLGSSNLLRAKLTVQENVREIIQLLNSPNIASQLEGFSDKSNLSHDMEKLNFNTGGKQRTKETESLFKNQGIMVSTDEVSDNTTAAAAAAVEGTQAEESEEENVGQDKEDGQTIGSASQDSGVQRTEMGHLREQEVSSGSGKSDVSTRVNDRDESKVSMGLQREETITLDEDLELDLREEDTNIDPPQGERDKALESKSEATLINEYLTGNQDISNNKIRNSFLKVLKKNILVTLDGELRHYKIDEDIRCFDTGMNFNTLDLENTKDVFWLDGETVMALTSSGNGKIWSTEKQKFINELSFVHNSEILDFNTVKATDYRGGYLLAANQDWAFVWKLNDTMETEVRSIYSTQCGDILDSVLGVDNESIVVLRSSSPSLVTYRFEGDVPEVVELEHLGPVSETPQVGRLCLNKETGDLLVQMDLVITIYSLKQRKIIHQSSLEKSPVSLYFKFATDLIGIAYSDGEIELRRANDFSSIVMSYNCHSEPNGTLLQEDVSQSSKILIDVVKFEGFEPIILSLYGDDTLKLETMNDNTQ